MVLSKGMDLKMILVPIQSNHVHRISALITNEIIRRHNLDSGPSSGIDCVWQISSVWNVVHAHVEPYNKVFLLQVIAVEEFVEINQWVVNVFVINGAGTFWFCVFLFGHLKDTKL